MLSYSQHTKLSICIIEGLSYLQIDGNLEKMVQKGRRTPEKGHQKQLVFLN